MPIYRKIADTVNVNYTVVVGTIYMQLNIQVTDML
jgi:hypothetical protein